MYAAVKQDLRHIVSGSWVWQCCSEQLQDEVAPLATATFSFHLTSMANKERILSSKIVTVRDHSLVQTTFSGFVV